VSEVAGQISGFADINQTVQNPRTASGRLIPHSNPIIGDGAAPARIGFNETILQQ
jgi:hypothetical protein